MSRRTSRITAFAASLAAIAPAVAMAADRHFISSNGPWATFSNWNPSGVPQPADNAIVDFFNGSPGRAAVSTNVGAVTSATMANGDTVAFTNGGTLLVGSGGINVGYSNTGGTLTMINPNPINFFQAGVTVTGEVHVGRLSGIGTITQNDGTVTLASGLFIGSSADPGSSFGSSGIYNFGGAGRLKGTSIQVGGFSRSVGTLNISGGIVTTDTLQAGFSGVGFINQSGGSVTVSSQVMVNSNSGTSTYTLTGGTLSSPSLKLDGAFGLFNYNGGSLQLSTLEIQNTNCRLNVRAGANERLTITSLQLGNPQFPVAGVLDLNDNEMALSSSQINYNEVRRDLRNAYNNGAWNGQGITSSLAAASPTHSTALGYGLVSPTLLVKYTYYGDTDLDGIVNFDDYSRADAGFNNAGTDWFHGDFNYDGVVNFDDFSLIDLAFNTQTGTLRQAMSYLQGGDRSDNGMDAPSLKIVADHFRRFGEAYASTFLNAVPEPSSVSVTIVLCMLGADGMVAIGGRRRR